MKKLEQLGISPAPWNEKVWATSDDYGHDISDYNHKSICDMRLLQGETRIPNARLIAAAPELYEALRGLIEIVCVDCKSSYEIDGKCVKCPRVVAAEAALKKAGGEE